MRSAVLAAAVALLIAGCGDGPAASPGLHTIDTTGMACGGTGLVDATLHGSANDPRVAWILIRGYGERLAVFPKGFTARFTPSLEIRDQSGKVAFREGDAVTEQCGGTPDGGMLIGWQP